eukprot:TRINITY_DN710_c0_g1_i3.p3 TRINITY_DN710_c0_g1~~TRINITY_DN710_c0_g1_i3.p3  ORF type:complete len:120 (+),score=20.64 TRINITY_DN710_c0_g1_i3:552-911(+)
MSLSPLAGRRMGRRGAREYLTDEIGEEMRPSFVGMVNVRSCTCVWRYWGSTELIAKGQGRSGDVVKRRREEIVDDGDGCEVQQQRVRLQIDPHFVNKDVELSDAFWHQKNSQKSENHKS